MNSDTISTIIGIAGAGLIGGVNAYSSSIAGQPGVAMDWKTIVTMAVVAALGYITNKPNSTQK